jgi:hypothetical protein
MPTGIHVSQNCNTTASGKYLLVTLSQKAFPAQI